MNRRKIRNYLAIFFIALIASSILALVSVTYQIPYLNSTTQLGLLIFILLGFLATMAVDYLFGKHEFGFGIMMAALIIFAFISGFIVSVIGSLIFILFSRNPKSTQILE